MYAHSSLMHCSKSEKIACPIKVLGPIHCSHFSKGWFKWMDGGQEGGRIWSLCIIYKSKLSSSTAPHHFRCITFLSFHMKTMAKTRWKQQHEENIRSHVCYMLTFPCHVFHFFISNISNLAQRSSNNSIWTGTELICYSRTYQLNGDSSWIWQSYSE